MRFHKPVTEFCILVEFEWFNEGKSYDSSGQKIRSPSCRYCMNRVTKCSVVCWFFLVNQNFRGKSQFGDQLKRQKQAILQSFAVLLFSTTSPPFATRAVITLPLFYLLWEHLCVLRYVNPHLPYPPILYSLPVIVYSSISCLAPFSLYPHLLHRSSFSKPYSPQVTIWLDLFNSEHS